MAAPRAVIPVPTDSGLGVSADSGLALETAFGLTPMPLPPEAQRFRFDGVDTIPSNLETQAQTAQGGSHPQTAVGQSRSTRRNPVKGRPAQQA